MEQKIRENEEKYNMTLCILSGIAIIMIVAGHAGYNLFTVGDLFPYYSFHVPLFMFISGYFYKEKEEAHPFRYCGKKVKRLLVPYFIWNLLYGIVTWLLHLSGFGLGGELNFWNLLAEPFISGYQFLYNYAAWFVPVLFIVEMLNLCMRLLLKKLHLGYEWLILAGSLFVGMTVVWLAIGGHVWGYYKMPGRILFLYPCFQMGQFYKKKLEAKDTLGNLPYFMLVIGIQLVLTFVCNGLAYSSVWCTGFANGSVIPYVTAVSGIAFWLRTAKILTPLLQDNRYVQYLGKNTYAIMMHHVMAFMLVKILLAGIAAKTGWFPDFDWQQFYHNIDYYYLVHGAEQFKMVYLLAGVFLPLFLQYGLDKIRKKWKGEGLCRRKCS